MEILDYKQITLSLRDRVKSISNFVDSSLPSLENIKLLESEEHIESILNFINDFDAVLSDYTILDSTWDSVYRRGHTSAWSLTFATILPVYKYLSNLVRDSSDGLTSAKGVELLSKVDSGEHSLIAKYNIKTLFSENRDTMEKALKKNGKTGSTFEPLIGELKEEDKISLTPLSQEALTKPAFDYGYSYPFMDERSTMAYVEYSSDGRDDTMDMVYWFLTLGKYLDSGVVLYEDLPTTANRVEFFNLATTHLNLMNLVFSDIFSLNDKMGGSYLVGSDLMVLYTSRLQGFSSVLDSYLAVLLPSADTDFEGVDKNAFLLAVDVFKSNVTKFSHYATGVVFRENQLREKTFISIVSQLEALLAYKGVDGHYTHESVLACVNLMDTFYRYGKLLNLKKKREDLPVYVLVLSGYLITHNYVIHTTDLISCVVMGFADWDSSEVTSSLRPSRDGNKLELETTDASSSDVALLSENRYSDSHATEQMYYRFAKELLSYGK